jgi:hypothetical protein
VTEERRKRRKQVTPPTSQTPSSSIPASHDARVTVGNELIPNPTADNNLKPQLTASGLLSLSQKLACRPVPHFRACTLAQTVPQHQQHANQSWELMTWFSELGPDSLHLFMHFPFDLDRTDPAPSSTQQCSGPIDSDGAAGWVWDTFDPHDPVQSQASYSSTYFPGH